VGRRESRGWVDTHKKTTKCSNAVAVPRCGKGKNLLQAGEGE